MRDPSPWIFQDELGYAELARSFAVDQQFTIRGGHNEGFGLLYPLLISPAYFLFESGVNAYDAIRIENAFLISASAVPTYLLARLVSGRVLSVLTAILSVAIFSMAYSGVVMTENAFYPAVAASACAMAYALVRPTIPRQLLVFLFIGLAFGVRVQAIVLVPAFVAAIALLGVADAVRARQDRLRVLWATVRVFWFSLALMAAGAVLLVAAQAARGASPSGILRGYSSVARTNYDWGEVAHWVWLHLAELDFATGIFPFAAFLLLPFIAVQRDVPREVAAIAAVALPVVAVFVISVSAYASQPDVIRIEERNLFHVVPLLFVSLAAWIATGSRRPAVPTVLAAMVSGLLVTAIPLVQFLNDTARHSTMSLLPLRRMEQEIGFDDLQILVGVIGLAAAGVFMLVPRRLTIALPVAVLAFFALGTWSVEGFTHEASKGARVIGVGGQPRDWIDGKVPNGDEVVQLVSGTNGYSYWVNEFFNNSVGRVYNLNGQHDSFPQETLVPDGDGILRTGSGESVRTDYGQSARWVRLRGTEVARDPLTGVRLARLDGPLAVDQRVEGVYEDLWSAPSVSYWRYACEPGTVVARLLSDKRLYPAGQTVTATAPGDRGRRSGSGRRTRRRRSPSQWIRSRTAHARSRSRSRQLPPRVVPTSGR